MKQFDEILNYAKGVLANNGYSELQIEDLFPVEDKRTTDIRSFSFVRTHADVFAFQAVSRKSSCPTFAIDSSVKFKRMPIGSYMMVRGDDSVYIKISKNKIWNLLCEYKLKIAKNFPVFPMNSYSIFGAPVTKIDVEEQSNGSELVPAALLDEASGEHKLTVADVKSIGAPTPKLEGQSDELPPASIQIHIGNNVGKDTKSKGKGKKKGKRK